ncbi:MAG TPA: DUF692 domain-containing protein [Usitatibacter sp.]|nr:DUF692 domain-containing protein [Usitatibacter sp.]
MGEAALAAGAGIGLRAPHHEELFLRRPALAFVEVHSEDFFGDGGPFLAALERTRALYRLSLHGVGLSLGSVDPLDERHLARLEALVRRFDPALVSEHLSWSSIDGRHANELLPLPRTAEAAAHVADRIARVQDRLGRRILVENVSTYLEFEDSSMPEWEFVMQVVRRCGCGLLLDVNNVYVNAVNHGFDPGRFLEAIDPASVGEYHLAGHEACALGLVDTHSRRVAPEVWKLYRDALARIGPRPTLVEWDLDLPALDVLLGEASAAGALLEAAHRAGRAALPA